MNTPEQNVSKAYSDILLVCSNLLAGRPLYDGIYKPDPEPQPGHYTDSATFKDAHDAWEERQGDALAEQTSEGCCGECP